MREERYPVVQSAGDDYEDTSPSTSPTTTTAVPPFWLSEDIASPVAMAMREHIEEAIETHGRVVLVMNVTNSTRQRQEVHRHVDIGASSDYNEYNRRCSRYISAHLHCQPPDLQPNEDDEFGHDLLRIWLSHDPTQMLPLIVVDLPQTWLRLIPLPWLEETERTSCCSCCGAARCRRSTTNDYASNDNDAVN